MPRRRAGTVFYLERIALPPTAELHVALFDVADPEQPEQIVAELTEFLGDRQVPLLFAFDVGEAEGPEALVVRAELRSDGSVEFESEDTPVRPGEEIGVRVLRRAAR